MKKLLVTPAIFKPLEVEAIKSRPELRIAGSVDNVNIADMLQSAIEEYEDFTDHILCLSGWDLYLDEFPDGDIETPAPLVSVESIEYLDQAGALQTVDESIYVVDARNPVFGRIVLAYGQSWPTALAQANSVIVHFTAGFTNSNSISQRVKDGLLLKIQELYTGVDLSQAYEACWSSNRRIHV